MNTIFFARSFVRSCVSLQSQQCELINCWLVWNVRFMIGSSRHWCASSHKPIQQKTNYTVKMMVRIFWEPFKLIFTCFTLMFLSRRVHLYRMYDTNGRAKKTCPEMHAHNSVAFSACFPIHEWRNPFCEWKWEEEITLHDINSHVLSPVSLENALIQHLLSESSDFSFICIRFVFRQNFDKFIFMGFMWPVEFEYRKTHIFHVLFDTRHIPIWVEYSVTMHDVTLCIPFTHILLVNGSSNACDLSMEKHQRNLQSHMPIHVCVCVSSNRLWPGKIVDMRITWKKRGKICIYISETQSNRLSQLFCGNRIQI